MLASGLLYSHDLLAQLKITAPVSRQIVQRDNNNQATVQIAGSYGQPLDAIEVRVVARAAGQGVTTDWTTLQSNPSNGQFNGTMIVKGGWYTIQVRGRSGGAIVASDELDRFGVGEVFAIMGHSNAQGSGCTIGGTDQCTTIEGATDDRVNVVAVDQNSALFRRYTSTGDTKFLPGLMFSQLTTTSGIAPFAKMPWLWSRMGDKLVGRINVPVLLYNAGFGGSNMQQTYWAAYDIPFSHSFIRYTIRMPYANVRNLMNLYVPTTGLRAILVQHGENDRDNPADSTYKYYRKVIEKTRTEFNKPALAHIIALSSYVGGRFENVRSAQLSVVNSTPQTFLGPDLDTNTDRPDGIHFSQTGQRKAGELWANAITDTYLATINPYLAQPQPLATISCATDNQLNISQPAGYQYLRGTDTTYSTNNTITVGAGTYLARIKDAQNKILFTPAVVVPASVRPAAPTISTANGTTAICQSTGLTLTSSYSGSNNWNTGSTAPSIVATTPGVYTVQAKNAVYGCLSPPASLSIGLADSDLSLSIQPSRKVVALNDTVTYKITVKNNGGCDAGQITYENRLPPNVAVVSVDEGLRVLNGDSSGNKRIYNIIDRIPANQSISAEYVARINAEGTYISAAELITITNPQPKAIPGNGTGNGEADEAQSDLRTMGASDALYRSPNPLQQPLPPVQSNQPAPEANKIDLSLSMSTLNRVVLVGNTTKITLTITNRGALAATNIGIFNLLPEGLQFVESLAMDANGNLVNARIAQIPAGQSVNLVFTARVLSKGVLTNKAQIYEAAQPDSDSTPDNGYTNGEDDEAIIDLRGI
ncbi:sialate O-acetylesterase [Spirosoma sp.]|uniref:sialate O-acetylesterase n=1 Tax=Spirosoma sp. TaxID=1899569 RepID=UPI003B3AE280